MTSSAHPDEIAPLTADDLERPTLERVRAFLDADRGVEADLVLQAWDRTSPDDPDAIPLRTRVAQVRMDASVRFDDCVFSMNRAGRRGGAIAGLGSQSVLDLPVKTLMECFQQALPRRLGTA